MFSCKSSLLKAFWEKEKVLVTSIFSFFHNVFFSSSTKCFLYGIAQKSVVHVQHDVCHFYFVTFMIFLFRGEACTDCVTITVFHIVDCCDNSWSLYILLPEPVCHVPELQTDGEKCHHASEILVLLLHIRWKQ